MFDLVSTQLFDICITFFTPIDVVWIPTQLLVSFWGSDGRCSYVRPGLYFEGLEGGACDIGMVNCLVMRVEFVKAKFLDFSVIR